MAATAASVPILCPKCAQNIHATLPNLNCRTLFFEHHLMSHGHLRCSKIPWLFQNKSGCLMYQSLMA